MHSLLPVGHTHSDVDATISRVSVSARHTNVETLEEFVKLIQEDSMSPRPHVEVIWRVADCQSFFDKIIEQPTGQSQPLGFKYEKVSATGRAGICTRRNSEWPWYVY